MNTMAWDLTSEYPSFDSKEFNTEFLTATTKIQDITEKIEKLKGSFSKDIPAIQEILLQREQISILVWNMSTYLMCQLSVDSSLAAVQARSSELKALNSKFKQALVPIDNFLSSCEDQVINAVLEHPLLQPAKFEWQQSRSLKDYLLTESEETLVKGLSMSGHHAWSDLYQRLSGTMQCELQFKDRKEIMGLAQASSLTRGQDEETRKVAWNAIQNAWSQQQESAAAILNPLAGWRLEVGQKRSTKKEMHFLQPSLHQNRIQMKTLEALLVACYDNVETSRRAPKAMARLMQKPQLDPWDLLAQSPVSSSGKVRSFEESVQMIEQAFAQVDPSMGQFVRMMADKNWIEARVLDHKRNGAYCTGFPKSRTPRVFMTFMGTNSDISTLAHELGHAYHNWVMRDMPMAETGYPMTLAETASIFSETLLHDELFANAKTKEEKIEFAWGEIEGATAFLLNIPSRFEFERNLYSQRQARPLSAAELSQLTEDAWQKWYGDSLSKYENLFWATKMHFSFSDASFYNYPYTFGYLFGMSIYTRRAELGKDFMKTYVNILRDTGRMTAEDVVQKHLGEDITKPEFWKKSIDVINKKITMFENLI